MHRTWAYILMIVATLAGGGALLWPAPQSISIEEIEVRSRPRVASRPAEPAGKPDKARPAVKPPSGPAKRLPPLNTSVKRLSPPPRPGVAPTPPIRVPTPAR